VCQGSFFWLQNTEGEPLVGGWLQIRILQPEKRTLLCATDGIHSSYDETILRLYVHSILIVACLFVAWFLVADRAVGGYFPAGEATAVSCPEY
jgi:hypothetical protein